MEAYTSVLNSVGDAIISWADPEGKFGGHTKVRMAFIPADLCGKRATSKHSGKGDKINIANYCERFGNLEDDYLNCYIPAFCFVEFLSLLRGGG